MKKLAMCHGRIGQDRVSIQCGNQLMAIKLRVELDNTYDNHLAIHGCQLDVKVSHGKITQTFLNYMACHF